jgi:hypothetical protein
MTRHSRAVALAAALACVGFSFTNHTAAQDAQATFRVEEADLNLGTILAGTIATATFVFHNDGPEDVRIIRAKPS